MVHDAFFEIYQEDAWIVSGHCPKGADSFAEKIAYDYGIPILIFAPKKRNKKELFARNTSIAKFSHIIIATPESPSEPLDGILNRKTGGTIDTLKKFRKFYPEGQIIIV